MKTKFSFLLSTIILAFTINCFTGCAGLSKTGKLTGYVGTSEALKQHPEWRPQFVSAEADLATLETSESIDVVNVLAIMRRLPVSKLDSQNAVIVITSATVLIEEFGGGSISLNAQQTDELRQFVHRLREGINLALATTPAGN